VIFEVREHEKGEYDHVVTLWKATKEEEKHYESTPKKKPVSPETIARLADDGKSVSPLFTNKGRMMGPIQRVSVDFASPMLEELNNTARELNISRQAAIKALVRQALDHHYLAVDRAATK
jgi:hypothetical protein